MTAPDANLTDTEAGALVSAVFHALGTHAISGHAEELERRLRDAGSAIVAARLATREGRKP